MPRRIKRYDNRKLYDTEASEYVSLSDIAELVRAGETIEVVDKASGQDLTAQTLTQIILEEGKSGHQMIPSELLHEFLRRSGEAFDQGLTQIRSAVDDVMQSSLRRLKQLVHSPRTRELDELRQQLHRLEHQLSSLLDDLDQQQRAATDPQSPRDADQSAPVHSSASDVPSQSERER